MTLVLTSYLYPLGHVSREYCLGNINDSPDMLVENLQAESNLPEAMVKKRKQDFSELVLKIC